MVGRPGNKLHGVSCMVSHGVSWCLNVSLYLMVNIWRTLIGWRFVKKIVVFVSDGSTSVAVH